MMVVNQPSKDGRRINTSVPQIIPLPPSTGTKMQFTNGINGKEKALMEVGGESLTNPRFNNTWDYVTVNIDSPGSLARGVPGSRPPQDHKKSGSNMGRKAGGVQDHRKKFPDPILTPILVEQNILKKQQKGNQDDSSSLFGSSDSD